MWWSTTDKVTVGWTNKNAFEKSRETIPRRFASKVVAVILFYPSRYFCVSFLRDGGGLQRYNDTPAGGAYSHGAPVYAIETVHTVGS